LLLLIYNDDDKEEEIEERCHSPWVIGDNRQQRFNSLKLLVHITSGDKRFPLLLLLVATKMKRKRKRKREKEKWKE
jgi:hypothetical protein